MGLCKSLIRANVDSIRRAGVVGVVGDDLVVVVVVVVMVSLDDFGFRIHPCSLFHTGERDFVLSSSSFLLAHSGERRKAEDDNHPDVVDVRTHGRAILMEGLAVKPLDLHIDSDSSRSWNPIHQDCLIIIMTT
jgi:hypothetical protein